MPSRRTIVCPACPACTAVGDPACYPELRQSFGLPRWMRTNEGEPALNPTDDACNLHVSVTQAAHRANALQAMREEVEAEAQWLDAMENNNIEDFYRE